MRLQLSNHERDFVEEVRDFLSTDLTEDLREAGRRTVGTHSDIDASREWHRRLYKKGWVAPAWPIDYGGAGWTPTERFLFDRECALNDAPILSAAGIRSLGPLLIEAGTRTQRNLYLQRILDGRDLWAQGFSEPNAGSDLAALKMSARRVGDEYIVNGTKIWTTGAHHANRIFTLVRTSQESRPQDGITFLLIDLRSHGLTIKPIITIDGRHEFNQLFFDDVRVPVENRVDGEGNGWSMAKLLMAYARSSNTTSGHIRRAYRRVRTQLGQMDPADPALLGRLAELDVKLSGLEMIELRYMREQGNNRPDIGPSMLKTLATELHQEITELGIEAAGYAALRACDLSAAKYLSTRAASIYSGTNEVHRNLLAGQIIGRL